MDGFNGDDKQLAESIGAALELFNPEGHIKTLLTSAMVRLSSPRTMRVATIQPPDPYDERCGLRFSLPDLARLNYLPAGTELHVLVTTKSIT